MVQSLNLSLITTKVADIKESLRILRAYACRKDTEFLGNEEAIRSARYTFIVMIEAAANIANHCCARLLEKAPLAYADAFMLMAEAGIISSDLALRLAQMARFRNLIVHGYARVDDARMLKIMRENLKDIDSLLQAISRLIQEQG